jgi:carboxypeptidase D
MVLFTIQTLSILPLLIPAIVGQFVSPPKDLIQTYGHLNISIRYKAVPPSICPLPPSVKSYTGYADVDKNQHLFFWFFEATDIDPKKAPLTVWINGGPGSSSMIGLWQELGPCWVDSKGKVRKNEFAWNKRSNLLVVDQPAQVS